MSRIQLPHAFQDIISLENLLAAWQEFVKGKRGRVDTQSFERCLMSNLISLHHDLTTHSYHHGPYQDFFISDPKPRHIHKASVKDRVLHHAIYRKLYPFFDRTFIADSYSCRGKKGTHKALNRFRDFARQVSWVLKMDITKFFASIDQHILLGILDTYIPDQNILWLLKEVITSFHSTKPGTGLPLGNLTSQLFVNIYMNEFDQWVKHKLKAKHYIRYADDFVLLDNNKLWLKQQIQPIRLFLHDCLHLELHPHKISLKTIASGIDFLGWMHFPDHRVLRTATKKRMFKRIQKHPTPETVQSYVGMLGHGNTHKLRREVLHFLAAGDGGGKGGGVGEFDVSAGG